MGGLQRYDGPCLTLFSVQKRSHTMKLNTSYIIAGSLLVIGAAWFAFNNSGEEAPLPIATPATAKENAQRSMPTVQVRRITSSEHPNVLELYGQTRANREVALKAETMGLVARTSESKPARN